MEKVVTIASTHTKLIRLPTWSQPAAVGQPVGLVFSSLVNDGNIIGYKFVNHLTPSKWALSPSTHTQESANHTGLRSKKRDGLTIIDRRLCFSQPLQEMIGIVPSLTGLDGNYFAWNSRGPTWIISSVSRAHMRLDLKAFCFYTKKRSLNEMQRMSH